MYFWIDEEKGLYKSYENLVLDINRKKYISKYIFYSSPYDVAIELIGSIIYQLQVEILDGDLSVDEIRRMGIDSDELCYKYSVEAREFRNLNEIYEAIEQSMAWRLRIYTSGTTGRPKKVEHNFQSLTRAVRRGGRHTHDIWGFCYNISHFAGLQVFFQAFLNHNTLLYLFECNREKFETYVTQYMCTHISATPTFYRNLIPCIKRTLPSVCSITMGGEKFDQSLVKRIRTVFPQAKIHNIYASTEAGSLFKGAGDCFEISDEIRPFLKVSNEKELLLHKSLLGNIKLEEDWYNTQDIVEIVDQNRIRFVSRGADMINVGGYKVNPLEVEEEIKKIDGVADAVVKGRANRVTGNILVAEIIKDTDEIEMDLKKRIVMELNQSLQKWKVPRILNFVEKIDQTRSGKKVRK